MLPEIEKGDKSWKSRRKVITLATRMFGEGPDNRACDKKSPQWSGENHSTCVPLPSGNCEAFVYPLGLG